MYISNNFYKIAAVLFVLYCCQEAWGALFTQLFVVGCGVAAILCLTDLWLIFMPTGKSGVKAIRTVPARMSCGSENEVSIEVISDYESVRLANVLDGAPEELQMRNLCLPTRIAPGESNIVTYSIRPTQRGEYKFTNIVVNIHTSLNIIQRKFVIKQESRTKVFPSYHFIRSEQLLSRDNYLRMTGNHATRRVGHSKEFDTVRDYTKGDDYRTINWKATARRGSLMVNQYVDETRKTIMCVIDKGRGMQHAFRGITLMDHAINASVQLSYIAMRHSDDAGLVTFNRKVDTIVSPQCNPTLHTEHLLHALYAENSDFAESDYTALTQHFTSKATRRSLLLLFTTLDSIETLHRRLPQLRSLTTRHTLLVIFFEDEDMKNLANAPHKTDNEYIASTLAHYALLEKKQLVKELRRAGIRALLTSPERLTNETINTYLQIKAEGGI